MPRTIAPDDESFWSGIRSQYDISPDFTNLENGFFGIPPRPVRQAFDRYNDEVNREGSFFMRTKYPQRLREATEALADFCGASAREVLVVRNPTEAMNILLQGYPWQPGDEVVCSDQEYDTVGATLRMLQQRGRFTLAQLSIPFETDSDDDIVALYEAAITPRTRAIVITHLLHRVGRIMPVARIAALARARGIDVFVDAAHSFGHLDYRLPDLGCDFVAGHLHKWINAPLGLGVLYIRAERVREIAPLFGAMDDENDIGKLGHVGTTPPASELAIVDALRFHQDIGGANKEARLRWLKEYWTKQVRGMARVRLLVPQAPHLSCGIASLRIDGIDAREVAERLMKEHRIFTAAAMINGVPALRVTPHLFTSTDDLDRLVAALRPIAA